jgi:hypothetical protein
MGRPLWLGGSRPTPRGLNARHESWRPTGRAVFRPSKIDPTMGRSGWRSATCAAVYCGFVLVRRLDPLAGESKVILTIIAVIKPGRMRSSQMDGDWEEHRSSAEHANVGLLGLTSR